MTVDQILVASIVVLIAYSAYREVMFQLLVKRTNELLASRSYGEYVAGKKRLKEPPKPEEAPFDPKF